MAKKSSILQSAWHSVSKQNFSSGSCLCRVHFVYGFLVIAIHYDHSFLKHYDLLTDRKKHPESSRCLVLLPHGKAPKWRQITPEMTLVQPAEQQHSVRKEAIISANVLCWGNILNLRFKELYNLLPSNILTEKQPTRQWQSGSNETCLYWQLVLLEYHTASLCHF